MTEEERFITFRNQNKVLLFIDGNYMINISRALSLKIDMERLFNDLTKEFFRHKTFWYSAVESNLERSNSTFRFLDRLKYIPRTEVYIGRLTRRYAGSYETALRNDAGAAMIVEIVEQAIRNTTEYIIIIAGDPEYIPAIRMAQKHGITVRLVSPSELSEFKPHSELSKTVDERHFMKTDYILNFEYLEEKSDIEEEDLEGNDDDFDTDEDLDNIVEIEKED